MLSMTTRRLLVPVLVVAVAAVLRLHNLTWNSMDSDEGTTLVLSLLPASQLLANFANMTLDPHPLLYYLIVKGWRTLAGASDVSLHLLSALAGILVVALTYRVGCLLVGRRPAALAAFFVALNAIVISESQDARNYAVAMACGLLALWMFLGPVRRPWPRSLPAWAVFGAGLFIMSYSHFVSGMLLPWFGLIVLIERRRVGARAWPALALVGGMGLLYVPFLFYAQRSQLNVNPVSADWRAWLSLFQQAVQLLLINWAPLESVAAGYALLAAAAGLIAVGVWRYRRGGSVALAWLFPQLVITFVVWMRYTPTPKTMYFVAPPFALLLAAGVEGLGRRAGWQRGLLTAALVALHFYGLLYLWRVGYQKDDWRNAARFLQAHVTPQDTALVHYGWYRIVLEHYYPAPLAYPWGAQIHDETEIENGLKPLLNSEIIWLVQGWVDLPGTDPEHLVEKWLSERYPLITAVYPRGITLKGFAVNFRTPVAPASATPASVGYPNGLTLKGYRLPETTLPVNDWWLHPPSTWVHATLYWSVARPLGEDIRVAVTLEDKSGQVWGGNLPREDDLRAFYPPLQWQPGEIVRQDFDVNTNPALLSGEYKIVLRVFPTGSDTPFVNNTGEDWFILGPITLAR